MVLGFSHTPRFYQQKSLKEETPGPGAYDPTLPDGRVSPRSAWLSKGHDAYNKMDQDGEDVTPRS